MEAPHRQAPGENGGQPVRLQPHMELLRRIGWNPLTSYERGGIVYGDLSEFSRPEEDPGARKGQVTALAYHALELATGLMSLLELARGPEPADPESARLAAISRAVALELMSASDTYSGLKQGRRDNPRNASRLKTAQNKIEDLTRTWNSKNTRLFRSLALLRSHNSERPSVDHMIGRDAEFVLRMFLAKQQGLIEDYDSIPL